MVVVLTAALAYRYYSTTQEGSEVTTDLERKLSEQWQRTESFRRDLVQSAFSCGGGPPNLASEEEPHELQLESNRSSSSITMSTLQKKSAAAAEATAAAVFTERVRQEWIDAVFGIDFFATPRYQPPRQGVGLAQIKSYTAYTVTIPASTASEEEEEGGGAEEKKVGLTLSSISIGVYVYTIQPESEAFSAGIREGSILVKYNTLGMLCEPSKQALERLWQYEGYFTLAHSAEGATTTTIENAEPVELTLLHHGTLYTVVLLSPPSSYGITWAPCGQFPLVQRSYSLASEAGVKRGSLLVSVNDVSLRRPHMNHAVAATKIKDAYSSGTEIQLTLCFTPAAARTGPAERAAHPNNATLHHPKRTALYPGDGVEVRVHPLAYSIHTLFSPNAAAATAAGGGNNANKKSKGGGPVAELAQKVASGQMILERKKDKHILSTMQPSAADRKYPPRPPLQSLVQHWSAWDAVAYCVLFHQTTYRHAIASPLDSKHFLLSEYQQLPMFMLECLALICESRSQQLLTCLLNQVEEADNHIHLFQSLYFLLQSYIATLTTTNTTTTTATRNIKSSTTPKEDINNDDDTVTCILELLQAAKMELTDLLTEQSTMVKVTCRGMMLELTAAAAAPPPPSSLVSLSTTTAELNTTLVDKETIPDDETDTKFPPSTSLPESGIPLPDSTKKKNGLRVLFRKSKSSSKSPQKVKRTSPTADSQTLTKSPLTPTTTTTTTTTTSPAIPTTAPILPGPIQSMTTTLVPFATLFQNMERFLIELDEICGTVERSLLKSISQKIADWALQPWSLSKQQALVAVTEGMRDSLASSQNFALVNPMEPTQVLTSVDPQECYILPSAHFPLLLTFNTASSSLNEETALLQQPLFGEERIYRTRVEVVSLRGAKKSPVKMRRGGSRGSGSFGSNRSFLVHAAVCGAIKESGRSVRTDNMPSAHVWDKGSVLTFDTRSSWGAPQTLSLRLSSVERNEDGCDQVAHADESGTLHYSSEIGFCWIDLRPLWGRIEASKSKFATVMYHAQICSLDSMDSFDEHGVLPEETDHVPDRFEIELRVTAELLPFDEADSGFQSRKRMLLYKHDDDLRQELFAIEFIKTCDALLKASGLDLKLLTFRCIPVGAKQGFIEWVPGSVPLSDICKSYEEVPLSRTVSAENGFEKRRPVIEHQQSDSEVARAGLTKYQSLHRLEHSPRGNNGRGALSNNPIQDFLRSVAYDPDSPYLVRKDVMDTYVKSCAGYCMVTYLLGVGDRHLDNLLLHQTGHFFHCDFSFILGEDPKTYLPMRITEDMVHGMGGKESDNYALFMSLCGAAFLALRRQENVRVVLSLVRPMVGMKELSIHANPDQALEKMRERLCLNLSDTEAVSYVEDLIETSISSKVWLAVDAIHSFGKRFN